MNNESKPVDIKIRPLQGQSEYRAVEQVQRAAWGIREIDIVPDHVLLTAQKNGGLVLGAFDDSETEPGRLVGFVFGFVGLTLEGKVKHCSHIAGVLPEYQNRNIGYRLKLAQRERVLAQGIDLITWTFDLLESRNARLNFHKLGVTCHTYLRNLYGDMRDELNVGVASDRFQVDWHIGSGHVAERLRGDWTGPSLAELRAEGVSVLNPSPPARKVLPVEGDRMLIQIPASFQAIKLSDMELARAWREHTRELFEAAFAAGYIVVDLLFQNNQSYYLLRKDWTPK